LKFILFIWCINSSPLPNMNDLVAFIPNNNNFQINYMLICIAIISIVIAIFSFHMKKAITNKDKLISSLESRISKMEKETRKETPKDTPKLHAVSSSPPSSSSSSSSLSSSNHRITYAFGNKCENGMMYQPIAICWNTKK
jgi:hypothetical protein